MTDLFRIAEKTESNALRVHRRDGAVAAAGDAFVDREEPVQLYAATFEDPRDRGLHLLTLVGVMTSLSAPLSYAAGAVLSLISMYHENGVGILGKLAAAGGMNTTIFEVNELTEGTPIPVIQRKEKADRVSMAIIEKSVAKSRVYNGTAFRGGKGGRNSDSIRSMGPAELASRVRTLITHIFVLFTKAITNPQGAHTSEERRLKRFLNNGDIEEDYLLDAKSADAVRKVIAGHLGLRKALIHMLHTSVKLGDKGGKIPQILAQISQYIRGSGLAGYNMVKRWAIRTKFPALADRALGADLSKYLQLMKMELGMGEKFHYIMQSDNPAASEFAPGQFPLLWSYAMGVASALDKQAAAIVFNKELLNVEMFKLGKSAASAGNRGHDNNLLCEIGVSEKEKDMMLAKKRFVQRKDEDEESSSDSDDDTPSGGTTTRVSMQRAAAVEEMERTPQDDTDELEAMEKEAEDDTISDLVTPLSMIGTDEDLTGYQ